MYLSSDMKTTIMVRPAKILKFHHNIAFLLVGFLLLSCSAVPRSRSTPESPAPSSSPYASGTVAKGLSQGDASPSLSPGIDPQETWMDLSWEAADGSSDTQIPETGGDGGNRFSLHLGSVASVARDGDETQSGSYQEEPGVRKAHLSDSARQENSDQERLDDAIDFCQKSQDLWREGRVEKAKACLDQAYQSILDIKANGDPEMIQQIDDLRFLISKRILEIYASRFNAVKGNHNEIPLVMNDHVKAEIKRFQTTDRDFFVQSYVKSGRYRPLILEKLEEAGLPLELSWLPLIESGFKVRALSRSRALGLWQFIPSTGYKFGLKRNQWIDERMDVEKSTNAAIAYLNELHEIFGDWTTVLAAYNCGEGTVLRVIRRQRINYLDNFWDLYERLPRETARYVPRYLAVLHIIKNPDMFGFELDGTELPVRSEPVRITKRLRLKDVAAEIRVPESVLMELNPELRYRATPETYSLRVPPEKADLLRASLAEIPRYVPPKRRYVYHRVRRGETLSHIARRYRTSIRAIANANNIRHKDFIRIGQKLKIPAR
jgi:membrane-bound lytic murein transglycosylase D